MVLEGKWHINDTPLKILLLVQKKSTMKQIVAFLLSVLVLLITVSTTVVMAEDPKVVVETINPAREGAPQVTTSSKYLSMVTLYIENADGSKTPSGWSTRTSDGADVDNPFAFQPGVGLIEGWTQGVLQMKEGERAWIHVPAALGYGDRSMGSPGGSFYIPASSNLLFDIEILVQDPARMEF